MSDSTSSSSSSSSSSASTLTPTKVHGGAKKGDARPLPPRKRFEDLYEVEDVLDRLAHAGGYNKGGHDDYSVDESKNYSARRRLDNPTHPYEVVPGGHAGIDEKKWHANSKRPPWREEQEPTHSREGTTKRKSRPQADVTTAAATDTSKERQRLQKEWERTDEELMLRKRLMETNSEEVRRLLDDLENRYKELLEREQQNTHVLKRQLASMREKSDKENEQYNETIAILRDKISRDADRMEALENDLSHTRHELKEANEGTEHLVKTVKHWRSKLADHEKDLKLKEEHAQRREDYTQQLKAKVLNLTSQVTFLQEKVEQHLMDTNALKGELHKSERRNNDLGAKLATSSLESTQRETSKIRQLQEQVDLLYMNNQRLLHIMADDPRLSKFVQIVGGDAQFVGHLLDAANHASAVPTILHRQEEKVSPKLAHDIRTAIHEHAACGNMLGSRRHEGEREDHVPLGVHNDGRRAAGSATGLARAGGSPLIQLHNEQDKWIPVSVFHYASRMREEHFPTVPASVLYTFVVEVCRLLRVAGYPALRGGGASRADEEDDADEGIEQRRKGKEKMGVAAAGSREQQRFANVHYEGASSERRQLLQQRTTATREAAVQRARSNSPPMRTATAAAGALTSQARRTASAWQLADTITDYATLDTTRAISQLQAIRQSFPWQQICKQYNVFSAPECRGVFTHAVVTIERLIETVRKLRAETHHITSLQEKKHSDFLAKLEQQVCQLADASTESLSKRANEGSNVCASTIVTLKQLEKSTGARAVSSNAETVRLLRDLMGAHQVLWGEFTAELLHYRSRLRNLFLTAMQLST